MPPPPPPGVLEVVTASVVTHVDMAKLAVVTEMRKMTPGDKDTVIAGVFVLAMLLAQVTLVVLRSSPGPSRRAEGGRGAGVRSGGGSGVDDVGRHHPTGEGVSAPQSSRGDESSTAVRSPELLTSPPPAPVSPTQ